MIKVLVISKILPISLIEQKKNENDILFVTEDEIKKRYSNICFQYLYPVPYANGLLGTLSAKWRSYLILKQNRLYKIRERNIFIIDIFLLPKKFPFRNYLYKLSLRKNRKRIEHLIQKFQPTVIHAQNCDLEAFLAKEIGKKYNIPYIVTLRELPTNNLEDQIIKNNLKSPKQIVAVSHQNKLLGQQFTANKINLIPHGVEEIFFKNTGMKPSSNKRLKIISVGKLIKRKNYDFLIRALAFSKVDFVLDIYGTGPERENLKLLIEIHNLQSKINFRGHIEHSKLPNIFPKYDLFALVSYSETLGRVYFEAMACGLPVIASQGTGVDGIITDGKEGFLVDSENLQSLSEKLNLIAADFTKLNLMGQNASALAKRFRWKNISSQLYAIYISMD